MPKLDKAAKSERDVGAIRGLRKHLQAGQTVVMSGESYTLESLVAVFEDHLAAMARVKALTVECRLAVARERALEARVLRVHGHIKDFARSKLGRRSARMKEFGLKPDKVPHMSAETKRRANVKRQATREQRGIIGKRRRAKLKSG